MKPRLVLVVTQFPKQSETFIASKFLGLLKRGWDVHVVCSQSRRKEWGSFPDLDKSPEARGRVHVNWPHRPQWLAVLLAPVAIFLCFCRNPIGTWEYLKLGMRKFGLDVFRRLYLDAAIVGLKPAAIHFEFGSLAVGRLYLKQLLGCKVVTSFRGYDLNRSALDQQDYFQEVWEHSDALHLLGKGLWLRAQERGCPATRQHVLIPPAIDIDFFEPGDRASRKGPAQDPVRILSVGRLTWEKGYEYAIHAVRVLTDMGIPCELRIVGDGVMLEALAFGRHQLNVTASVHLLGALPRGKVREEMLAADIFLHAAVSEGFGNAIIEAQAMGLPVVCTDAGGLPENVADGETGFVVPRRDPAALAEKLAVLARDPELGRRMGEAGRRRVLAHFEIKEQISKFEALYKGVFDGEKPGVGCEDHSAGHKASGIICP